MRYHFVGTEVDEHNVEWCFLFDAETGFTLKSQVKLVGGKGGNTGIPVRIPVHHVQEERPAGTVDLRDPSHFATRPAADATIKTDKHDPNGEIETPEQRKIRLGQRNKVPPAFLGNISRMGLDPAKTENGVTDVTRTG